MLRTTDLAKARSVAATAKRGMIRQQKTLKRATASGMTSLATKNTLVMRGLENDG